MAILAHFAEAAPQFGDYGHGQHSPGTCHPNPCGHNAICEPLPANQRIPMCECPIGYSGDPYTICIKELTSLGSWSSWNIGENDKTGKTHTQN